MKQEQLTKRINEMPITELKLQVAEALDQANKVMGKTSDENELKWLTDWTYNLLDERYNSLPMHHFVAAIKHGSLGERGGTAKLIPRNIAIWLREQNQIYQDQLAYMERQMDEGKKKKEMSNYKPSEYVAAAVRMKVHWLADGRITGEEYDTFSSQAIYKLLMSGIPEGRIHPRDVVPNYDENRREI